MIQNADEPIKEGILTTNTSTIPIIEPIPLEEGWIRLDVAPLTSPRPRLTKRGWAYLPEWYKTYTRLITEELTKNNVQPADYSELEMYAFFKYPKSTPKKLLIEGAKMRKKPDFDNVSKTIADCLKKAEIIADDNQLSDGNLKKRYTLGEGYFLIKLII